MDPLEKAVLSGALFRDGAADMSEYRHEDRQTPSPEPNTDDELGSDYSPPSSPRAGAADSGSNSRSTGVKGVLKDHKDAARRTREDQIARRLLANEALEERALLGPTWQEDEDQRAFEQTEEGEAVRKWERTPGADGRERPTNGAGAHAARDRKGYLREVSMQGYLSAVEDAPGWVVILIFEPVSRALENFAPAGRADRPALVPRSLPRTSRTCLESTCSPCSPLPLPILRQTTLFSSRAPRPSRSCSTRTDNRITTSCRPCSSTHREARSGTRSSASTWR